jgi:hypothetical protein
LKGCSVLLGLNWSEPERQAGAGGSSCTTQQKVMIWLDEPHDGEMRPAMVRRLQEQLESLGLL